MIIVINIHTLTYTGIYCFKGNNQNNKNIQKQQRQRNPWCLSTHISISWWCPIQIHLHQYDPPLIGHDLQWFRMLSGTYLRKKWPTRHSCWFKTRYYLLKYLPYTLSNLDRKPTSPKNNKTCRHNNTSYQCQCQCCMVQTQCCCVPPKDIIKKKNILPSTILKVPPKTA